MKCFFIKCIKSPQANKQTNKQTINLKMTTTKSILSLPPKHAPYMRQEDICPHCYRESIFKYTIDLKCGCCVRHADDDDDYPMPMLECLCVDCRINNNTQDTRVEEDNDKEVRDILLLYPDYSASKEWSYISKEDQLWFIKFTSLS